LDESDSTPEDESGAQVVALDDEEADEAAETVARRGGAVLDEDETEEHSDVDDLFDIDADSDAYSDSEDADAQIDADEDEEAVAPAKRKATERQATIRYYSRMNPQRTYPLLVVLSKKDLLAIRQKHVSEAKRQVQVQPDAPVEI